MDQDKPRTLTFGEVWTLLATLLPGESWHLQVGAWHHYNSVSTVNVDPEWRVWLSRDAIHVHAPDAGSLIDQVRAAVSARVAKVAELPAELAGLGEIGSGS